MTSHTLRRRTALLGALALATGAATAWAGAYEDFFSAVERDDADTVNSLLRRGFDPNIRDPKGQVGLTLAIQAESLKVFAALIANRRLKVEIRNRQDESPLMMAALKGNVDAVKALMGRDADVNKEGWAPLHYAASGIKQEHVRIIGMLLENHAYIDATSPNGTTPLMMAAQYGSNDAVQLLLNEGADPTLKNQLGLTAVDFAMRVSRTEAAEKIATAIRRRQPNAGKW
ncbi:ankyrin repeat domain-containing protein [Acidovorax sp. A1169]|uniref:ankyrin repeat domain-containing protein n=1 Tax=Acidovorax sp. A1169 TaxID=3059524 RepID=UPI0027378085|nr:ankyrin repeat domain-containing protein [Acidovorax sp. A1169]MDP4075305.1 ankyrin repeat domain-containing protein [Acidovorax sp. A1169]